MRKKKLAIVCCILAFVDVSYAQLPVNDLYQYNYVSINSAFAGVSGHSVSFMGSILIPGARDYRVTNGFAGFEANASKINTGFGISAATVQRGYHTHSYLNGFSNYRLKLKDNSAVHFGLKLSSFQAVIDFDNFVSADQDDPILGFPTLSVSNIRGGAAILYKRNKFFAGLTVDNIIRSPRYEGLEYKQFSFQCGADFDLGPRVTSINSVYAFSEDDYQRFDVNSSFLINKKLIAGCSLEVNSDGWVLPKLNGGLNFKDRGRLLVVLYSRPADEERKFRGQMMFQVRF